MIAKTRVTRFSVKEILPAIIIGIAVLIAIALKQNLEGGQLRLVGAVFMFIALAQAWNIIGGFTGYASFGHVVFFGMGGYFTAVVMSKYHFSFWLALPLSGIFAAAFAALIGRPLLKLKGHYFAIATLSVAEGMREIVHNLPDLTGGGAGISVPIAGKFAATEYLGDGGFYLLFLAVAVLSLLIGASVSRSKFGYGLRAIHQNEDAAAAVGINTVRTKVLAYALSAFVTGVVGSVYVFQQVTIFPERLFDVEITVLMIMMVVIGGSGTIIGPLLGALWLQFTSDYLRETFTNFHTIILGVIIIVAVILIPQGAVNFLREGRRTKQYSLLSNVRKYRL